MYKYKGICLEYSNSIEIEVNVDIKTSSYDGDYVELYPDIPGPCGITIRIPVYSEKEAYYLFEKHGIEWPYDNGGT